MNESKQKYKIEFTKTAQKDYESIRDAKLLRGINRIIDEIKEDPYQFKKLSGPFSHLRSAKTFSFRVLYQIAENGQLLVWVISIDHRKDVYR
ncbi:MAG: type II toxin-antitoxin system RelE/ParE family toxin [Candidatus Omnitrophica bacterium]|nr:type II toxin-antitoxin system RelE/ParE family toxin [Candidatus Omnitrophota bacterium]